ncbi:MAG: serine/threonine protein kinase [Planctomycetota bacterium]|nr:MAG: serine/threonine protein kinase [Planctomycetota bacterium]
MPAAESLETFLSRLNRSKLLSREQMADLCDVSHARSTPRELANWLVQQQWLTRWQATQLQEGHEQLHVGKFRLLNLIGRGGMGLVFLAEQTSPQKIVALKVMTQLGNPKGMKRYLQEVRAASALNHPHIVCTLESGVADGCHFLVMEFLDGLDLWETMRTQAPLSVSWSCEVVRQVALGLQHAHEQGMVHRDIKPSNIFVSPNPDFATPHARILDFGLAHIATESLSMNPVTQTGAVLGTPDYISPEQAMSAKHADIRSDIFSLGCTLFQMLTGDVPFPGDNVMEKLMGRLTSTPPSVSALRAEAHSDLDDLVANMLRSNANDRPQTPIEVADELGRLALKIRRHESRIANLSPARATPHSQSRSRLRRS